MTRLTKCLHCSAFFRSSLKPDESVRTGENAMTNANRAILLATLSTFALAAPAGAQVNPKAEQNAQAQQQAQVAAQGQTPVSNEQTIIVTGTRSANRTVANSPVPVDVIGADQIAASGQT